MTTINEPDVIVTDVERIKTKTYGNAGKLAVIGAFPTSTFQIGSFTRLEDAQSALGASTIPEACVSYACLEPLFEQDEQSKGAEDILIVNTNYQASTLSYTITNELLANALLALTDEDFDILNIADVINLEATVSNEVVLNPLWTTLKTFSDSQYRKQTPFGLITSIGIDKTSTTGDANLTALKNLFHDKGVYKLITTPIQYKYAAEPLNLAQSGCWHANYTAGRQVNKSETSKIYKSLQGIDSKSEFPISTTSGVIDWENLLDAGLHTMKYHDRRLKTIKCINNWTPAGYDMKVERVKNYMIKRLTFTDVFGEDNNEITLNSIKGLFEYEKNLALKNNYLTDMEYEITHCSSDCVRAKLKLVIPEVIRHIRVDVAVEITPYEEA